MPVDTTRHSPIRCVLLRVPATCCSLHSGWHQRRRATHSPATRHAPPTDRSPPADYSRVQCACCTCSGTTCLLTTHDLPLLAMPCLPPILPPAASSCVHGLLPPPRSSMPPSTSRLFAHWLLAAFAVPHCAAHLPHCCVATCYLPPAVAYTATPSEADLHMCHLLLTARGPLLATSSPFAEYHCYLVCTAHNPPTDTFYMCLPTASTSLRRAYHLAAVHCLPLI